MAERVSRRMPLPSPAILLTPSFSRSTWDPTLRGKNIDTDLVWVPDQYYSHSIPGFSTYTMSTPRKHDLGTVPGLYQELLVYRWYNPECLVQTWCESHIPDTDAGIIYFSRKLRKKNDLY